MQLLHQQPTPVQTAPSETSLQDATLASSPVLLTLVSWLFLIGSLIFQLDALLELSEGLNLHVVFHLSASLLFTVGSLLFVIHDYQQKR